MSSNDALEGQIDLSVSSQKKAYNEVLVEVTRRVGKVYDPPHHGPADGKRPYPCSGGSQVV